MLDPSSTKVLARRIGAGVIDFMTVSLLALYFAKTQSEEFAITGRNVDGEPIWSTTDFDRIQSYAGSFNRSQEIGDTLHVFDFLDVLLILLVTSLLALLLKVLIPANTSWSLGQGLLGLRVIDSTGDNPPVSQHLARMWPAIVDVLPVVLPGLVGWIVASRSEHNQRIGDRVASTYVISRSAEPQTLNSHAPAVAASPEVSTELPPAPGVSAGQPPAPGVGDLPDLSGDMQPPAPVLDVATPPAPTVDTNTGGRGLADKFNMAKSNAGPAATIDGLNVDAPRLEDLSANLPDGPTVDEPSPVTPPTIAQPDLSASSSDLPPVDMPSAAGDVTAPDLGAAAFDTPTADLPPSQEADQSTATDTGRPPPPAHRTAAERRQLFQETTPPTTGTGADPSRPTDAGEATGVVEKTTAPPPRHRVERTNWDAPVAETAPVWTPVAPGDDEQLAAPEPAIIEPVVEPNAEAPSLEPQWNEEWNAWMFWDEGQQSWLRHDTDNDAWIKVDP